MEFISQTAFSDFSHNPNIGLNTSYNPLTHEALNVNLGLGKKIDGWRILGRKHRKYNEDNLPLTHSTQYEGSLTMSS